MRARTKVILAVFTGVAAVSVIGAVAAPTLYRTFFVAPPESVPTLSADDSALRAVESREFEPEELTGEWLVGEGSRAGYRVDEVLNGSPVTVTGRTSDITGSLIVSGFTLDEAEFSVDVASIQTDSPQRDQYFRQQAIDTAVYPTATFVLTDPVTVSEPPAVGEVTEHTLSGDLSIAGTTRPVTVVVQLRSDGARAEIAGQIPITFSDFGVEAPHLGFVAVEPTGFIEFSLVAHAPQ